MDDGRLANEMTLEGISKQLTEIKDQVTALDSKVIALDSKVIALDSKLTGVDGKVGGLDQRMAEGFKRVDEQLNAAKARDEDLHSLFKFSLEANDALRESMESRFEEAAKKQDEDIDLLKAVQRHLSRSSRSRGPHRKDR